jgi:hypothetical protein
MAAGVRSDCRIVRAGAGMRAHGSERRGHRRMLPTTQRKSGRVDLHLKSARKATIMVALTGRGRGPAASSPGHEHEDQGPRA